MGIGTTDVPNFQALVDVCHTMGRDNTKGHVGMLLAHTRWQYMQKHIGRPPGTLACKHRVLKLVIICPHKTKHILQQSEQERTQTLSVVGELRPICQLLVPRHTLAAETPRSVDAHGVVSTYIDILFTLVFFCHCAHILSH